MRIKVMIVIAMAWLVLAGCGNESVLSGSIGVGDSGDTRPIVEDVVPEFGNMQDNTEPEQIVREGLAPLDKDKVISNYDEYDSAEYPILAATPERDMYLYDDKISDGLFLRVGEMEQQLKGTYMTGPRFVLPSMLVGDFDSDGVEELAIRWYLGGGTGVSVDSLMVVELAEDRMFTVHEYRNYEQQLESAVRYKPEIRSDDLIAEIAIGDDLYMLNLTEFQNEQFGSARNVIVWGSIVHFGFEDGKITGKFAAGLVFEGAVTPQYVGDVHANVVFEAGGFSLSNLKFEVYEGYY